MDVGRTAFGAVGHGGRPACTIVSVALPSNETVPLRSLTVVFRATVMPTDPFPGMLDLFTRSQLPPDALTAYGPQPTFAVPFLV